VTTTMHRMSLCPECGTEIDASTSVTRPKRPRPGDLSVCFKCGALLTYNADLSVRALPPEEFAALPAETQVTLIGTRELLRRFHAEA